MDKIVFYGSINTHNVAGGFDIVNAETILSKYRAGGFHSDEVIRHDESDPNLLHFRLTFTSRYAVDNLIDILNCLDNSILEISTPNRIEQASASILFGAITYLQHYDMHGPDYQYTETNGKKWNISPEVVEADPEHIASIYEFPQISDDLSLDWKMTINIRLDDAVYAPKSDPVPASDITSDPAPSSEFIRKSDVIDYLTEFRNSLMSKSYSSAITESLSTSVAKAVNGFIETISKMPGEYRDSHNDWCRSYIKPIEKKLIMMAIGDAVFTEHSEYMYAVGMYDNKTWWIYEPATKFYKGLAEPPVYWKYVDLYKKVSGND